MSKVEKAISWMETTAKNNSHGYDQQYRWGERGDYDCSSAVITAFEQAGVPVKTSGATYTGNMLSVFKKCGFVDVTSKVNLKTGSGLLRGDVLLNIKHHTAMYCGNGLEVEASINEKGRAIGGVPGDQTGKEFLIRSYRNYPWDRVLRYVEKTDAKATTPVALYKATVTARSGLNIRTGAGMGFARVGSLAKGTEVSVYDEVTGWARINPKTEKNGQWCSTSWLGKIK